MELNDCITHQGLRAAIAEHGGKLGSQRHFLERPDEAPQGVLIPPLELFSMYTLLSASRAVRARLSEACEAWGTNRLIIRTGLPGMDDLQGAVDLTPTLKGIHQRDWSAATAEMVRKIKEPRRREAAALEGLDLDPNKVVIGVSPDLSFGWEVYRDDHLTVTENPQQPLTYVDWGQELIREEWNMPSEAINRRLHHSYTWDETAGEWGPGSQSPHKGKCEKFGKAAHMVKQLHQVGFSPEMAWQFEVGFSAVHGGDPVFFQPRVLSTKTRDETGGIWLDSGALRRKLRVFGKTSPGQPLEVRALVGGTIRDLILRARALGDEACLVAPTDVTRLGMADHLPSNVRGYVLLAEGDRHALGHDQTRPTQWALKQGGVAVLNAAIQPEISTLLMGQDGRNIRMEVDNARIQFTAS